MADDLVYSDLDPFSSAERQSYLRVVGKKNAVKLPGGQYYFNLKEQVFDPYSVDFATADKKKPVVPTEDEYYLTAAPTYSYAIQLNEGGADTFEGAVAKMVKDGSTPSEINAAITDAFADDDTVKKWGIDLTKDYVYKGTAETIWKDYNQAKTTYDGKVAEADAWVSPYEKEGIPDPSLRYDPTKFDNYRKYEQTQIAKARKILGTNKETPTEKRFVQELRKNAAEYYASKGRTPYYDAILRLEANK